MRTINKRILIAEDDSDDVELMKDAFEEQQFRGKIDFVRNGREALNYLDIKKNNARSQLPHLIILDFNMPMLNGLEVLQSIKQGQLRSIPVIIYSTNADPTQIAECYKHGANTYFVKPGEFSEISSLIGNLTNYWFRGAAMAEN